MVVRELLIKLGIKSDPQGFQRVDSGMKKLVNGAKLLATAFAAVKTVQFFKNIAVETAALGDAIDKTSKKLGINAAALQELQFAANLAGASNQDLNSALRLLAKNANEAAQGSKEFSKDFDRLGVTVTDVNGQLKPAEQLFTELGDGLAALKSDTERAALAQSLLGRSGVQLVPLLKQGSKAIAEQRKEARELGLIDQELIDLSVEFTDDQTRLGRAFQSIRNIIAKALLPGFTKVTKAVTDFIKNNRELIQQKIVGFLTRMGRVFGSIANAIKGVIDVTRRWLSGLGPIQRNMLKIAAVAAAIALLTLSPVLALLAVGIAVGLVLEDYETWRKGGDSVIGDLIKKLQLLESQFPNVGASLRVLARFFEVVFGGLANIVNTSIDTMLTFFREGFGPAIETLLRGLEQTFGKTFAGIIRKAVNFVKEITKKITDVVDVLPDFLKAGGPTLSPAVLGALGGPGSPLGFLGNIGQLIGAAQGGSISAPTGGGGSTVNNTQGAINVTVNAGGITDPEALSRMVGEKVKEGQDRQNRETLQSIAVGTAL